MTIYNNTSINDLDNLARILLTSSDNKERQGAEEFLTALEKEPNFYATCLQAISQTSESTTQLFILSKLSEKLTIEWSNQNFEDAERIQTFLFEMLLSKFAVLPSFIILKLCHLLARICCLSWLLHVEQQKTFCGRISSMMEKSYELKLLGMHLFQELVTEVNSRRTTATPSIFRRRSLSFHEECLTPICETSLFGLQCSMEGNGSTELLLTSLTLLHTCLSYDFIGSSWGESSEEFFTVQMPSSWKKMFGSEGQATNLLYAVALDPSQDLKCIGQALSNLVLMLNVRRPSNAQVRKVMLNCHTTNLVRLFQERPDLLADHFLQLQICRMVASLKANYQLTEIMNVQNIQPLLENLLSFTLLTFSEPDPSIKDTSHYLVEFWARYVMAIPYVRNLDLDLNLRLISNLAENYLKSRLECIKFYAQTHSEDGESFTNLFPRPLLLQTIEHFRYLLRLDYDAGCQMLIAELQPRIDAYMSMNPITNTEESIQFKQLEMQLGWICFMISGVLGISRPLTDKQKKNESQLREHDATLISYVFRLISLTNERINGKFMNFDQANQMGFVECSAFLDESILRVLASFQEGHLVARGTPRKMKEKNTQSLLQLLRKKLNDPSIDENAIVSGIIDKAYLNLQKWNHPEILRASLKLLHDLTNKFRNKAATARITEKLIKYHSSDEFSFKLEEKNFKLRTEFCSALYDMLMELDDYFLLMSEILNIYDNKFSSLQNVFNNHNNSPGIDAIDFRELVGIIRDLRGFARSIQKTAHYRHFWKWLEPYFWIFEKVCVDSIRTSDINALTPTLKFIADLTLQKYKRISFNPSSVHGIKLLKHGMELLVNVSKGFQKSSDVGQDNLYKSRYKIVSICLKIFRNLLDGEFVRYGQLLVFGETCVRDGLVACLEMVNTAGLENLLYFPKISKEYWGFCRALVKQQLSILVEDGELQIFDYIFKSISSGLTSRDFEVCSGSIIFIFNQIAKKTPDSKFYKVLDSYMEKNGEYVFGIFRSLLHILFFENPERYTALCHALYSIMLIYPQVWELYYNKLCSSQETQHARDLCLQLGDSIQSIKFTSTKNDQYMYSEVFNDQMISFRKGAFNVIIEPVF